MSSTRDEFERRNEESYFHRCNMELLQRLAKGAIAESSAVPSQEAAALNKVIVSAQDVAHKTQMVVRKEDKDA